MGMGHATTEEQNEVLSWLVEGRGHAVLQARAGSGKTWTILRGLGAYVDVMNEFGVRPRIMALAFNKSAADELDRGIQRGLGRANADVKACTLHHAGLALLKKRVRDAEIVVSPKLHRSGKLLRAMLEVLRLRVAEFDAYKGRELDLVEEDLLAIGDALGNRVGDRAAEVSDNIRKDVSNYMFDCRASVGIIKREVAPVVAGETLSAFIRSHTRPAMDKVGERIVQNRRKVDVMNKVRVVRPSVEDAVVLSLVVIWVGVKLMAIGRMAIGFDDMVYAPVALGPGGHLDEWKDLDLITVDEAQDLSTMQRKLAMSLGGARTRYLVVGDRFQSVYAFNGADSMAMDHIAMELRATGQEVKLLSLTLSFRCPPPVIQVAQKFVPDICGREATDAQPVVFDGYLLPCHGAPLEPDSVVLCRANRPLIGLYWALWREGYEPTIRGTGFISDVFDVFRNHHKEGEQISETFQRLQQSLRDRTAWSVRDLQEEDMLLSVLTVISEHVEQFEGAADALQTMLTVLRSMKCEKVQDQERELPTLFSRISINGDGSPQASQSSRNSLIEAASQCESPMSAKRLRSEGPLGNSRKILLSTIHQAKGREWDNVYILQGEEGDRSELHLPGDELTAGDLTEDDIQQELNCHYVAVTRAKRRLTYLIRVGEKTQFDEEAGKGVALRSTSLQPLSTKGAYSSVLFPQGGKGAEAKARKKLKLEPNHADHGGT